MAKSEEQNYDTLLGRAPESTNTGEKRYAALYVLIGITGLGTASMGFGWWNRADYFHHIGEYPNGWVGYDVFAFIGLLLFTVFSPSGVTLLYVGVSTLMRLWGGMLGLAVFGALGVVLVVVGSLGMVWGNETMQCLGIFCVDTAKYALVPGARPEAGRSEGIQTGPPVACTQAPETRAGADTRRALCSGCVYLHRVLGARFILHAKLVGIFYSK
ncbi:hypothetical protein LSM04_007193 [Trypanosoma melophagium]|uniref:uncharacterized protein n=1 Tax=Trypanosoma melophagium TaxID=715481 RepID=UPI00351A9968|nr:hypothetical protein LSM04_007193 [Trypanosoma melophagium]